jgi:hypothetical protein
MGWVLLLVEAGVDGSSRSVDVMAIGCPGDLGDIAALGLTLAQGKQLVALVQQEIATAQSRDPAVRRPLCRSCRAACQVKDYSPCTLGFAGRLLISGLWQGSGQPVYRLMALKSGGEISAPHPSDAIAAFVRFCSRC